MVAVSTYTCCSDNAIQNGHTTHLFLNRERDAQALRVWFRPDEMGLGEAHLVESLQPLQTQSEELLRFRSCESPCRRRRQETFAVAAERDRCWVGLNR